MNEKFEIKKFLKYIRTEKFILGAGMPLGYVAGYPIIQNINGKVCILIPYLRYKVTGKPDQTEVYPIKYTVTAALKPVGAVKELIPVSGKKEMPYILPADFIKFEDLGYNKDFEKIKFDKPIGTFRHKAIQNLNKTEYTKMQDELYSLYDAIITAELNGEEPQTADKLSFKQLIGTLLEPSLMYIYKMLDETFYNKYLQ